MRQDDRIDYRGIAERQALAKGACPRCAEKWGGVPMKEGDTRHERDAYAEHVRSHLRPDSEGGR